MSRIEAADPHQAAALQAIEVAAASRYVGSLWPQRAALPPMPVDSIAAAARRQQAWTRKVGDVVVAFIIARPIDDLLYVAELDVDPAFAGARHGAALLHHATALAESLQLRGISLFTFVQVPWNEPYYRSIGFQPMPQPLPAEHQRLWQEQADSGLPIAQRIAMQRLCRPSG